MKSAQTRWMGWLAAGVLAFGGGTVRAATETVGGVAWGYEIVDGTATVTNANPASGDLSIPSSLGGVPVTRIGEKAFMYGYGIWEVTIPEGVTEIGSSAFAGCQQLYSVTIPDSVTSIGEGAFADCWGWTGGPWDMYETGLNRVVIGNGVTNIGRIAFVGCGLLSDVSWGDNIECIGAEAFYGCPITNIAIGAKTWFIGDGAFAGNNALRTISVAEGNPAYAMIDGVLYTQDGKNLIRCPGGREGATHVMSDTLESIGVEAFSGCVQLVSVDIPSGVTNIGTGAFSNCRGLETVEIPTGVTSLASRVFYNCGGLTGVAIPGNVASIGDEAFSGCTNLLEVNIADGVERLEKSVFASCRKLESVTVPGSLRGIASSAFSGCTNLASVHIRDLAAWCGISFENANANPLSYAKHLYLDGEEVTDLAVPDGVSRVGNYAFYGCSGLTRATMSGSVTDIGASAFSGCVGLAEISIPDSVERIGSGAFSGCANLGVVRIHDLAAWCGIAFENRAANPLSCAKHLYVDGDEVTHLTVPGGVSGVGDHAFCELIGLVSVSIPGSVERIGNGAFSGCVGLAEISIADGVEGIGASAFSGCASLTELTIPGSVETIGTNAFHGCSGLAEVVIPGSVTSLANSVFSGCSGLVAVTIPGSVTNIGKSAFSGCAALAELTIPDSVETIGTNALAGCSGLSRLEVPGSWWGTDKVATAGVPTGCEVTYRGVEPLAVATAALPGGKTGRSYRAVLEATGGTVPYEWAWLSGEYAETEAASTFSETGTASGSGTQTLELPFAFPFFESAYTRATIDDNGNIRFQNFQAGSPTIEVLRLEYWGGDDWQEGPWMQTDAISVEKAEDAVTVRWAGCYMWYDSLYMEYWRDWPVNFSATLHADGTIVLSYGEGNNYGGEIGLFAGDGRAVLSAKSGSGSMNQASDVVFLPPKGVPGLALAEGGVLQGTPEEAGTYPVRVWVADASGAVASRDLTLTIVEGGGGDATETTPVAVPHSWLESEAASILAENGGDYEAAAKAEAMNGRPLWQCYVAGLKVTDPGAEFKLKSIRVEDGVAHVEWDPDLREDEVPRAYTVWGTSELGAEVGGWTPVTADNIREMRYFAVEVEMGK